MPTINFGESVLVPRCRRLTLQESTPMGYPTRRRPGLKGVDTKNKKNSCSCDSSSVCAVRWVRGEWIQIPSCWRFCGELFKKRGEGEEVLEYGRGGVFRIRYMCLWGQGQIYKLSLTCRCRPTLGTISSYL